MKEIALHRGGALDHGAYPPAGVAFLEKILFASVIGLERVISMKEVYDHLHAVHE